MYTYGMILLLLWRLEEESALFLCLFSIRTRAIPPLWDGQQLLLIPLFAPLLAFDWKLSMEVSGLARRGFR